MMTFTLLVVLAMLLTILLYFKSLLKHTDNPLLVHGFFLMLWAVEVIGSFAFVASR